MNRSILFFFFLMSISYRLFAGEVAYVSKGFWHHDIHVPLANQKEMIIGFGERNWVLGNKYKSLFTFFSKNNGAVVFEVAPATSTLSSNLLYRPFKTNNLPQELNGLVDFSTVLYHDESRIVFPTHIRYSLFMNCRTFPKRVLK